jgi:sensor histidine kinase YesM
MSVKYKVFLHTSAWVMYFLIVILGAPELNADFLINTVYGLVLSIMLFYVTAHFLLPTCLPHRKILLLITGLLVVNVIIICLRLTLPALIKSAGFNDILNTLFSNTAFWNQFRVNMLFIGISFAYWYAQRNYNMEQDRRALEKEILEARLNALKHQINPHFLYNSLSFLYTRALSLSKPLADAISRLSDMIRYSLGEVGSDGRVELEKELRHLKNFIEMHQLRFDGKLNVILNVQGDCRTYRIMPLLLITFVENAFKHGKLNDNESPLQIDLGIQHSEIRFSVRNNKDAGIKERSSGIGLQNLRSRLELAYPGKYQLNIENRHETFYTDLRLKSIQ